VKSFNLIKLAAISVFSLVAMLGTSQLANAQSNGGHDQGGRTVSRQRGHVYNQPTNVEQQRRADVNRRNDRGRNDRYHGNGRSFNNDRYQVNRNRSSHKIYNSRNRSGYNNGRSMNIRHTVRHSGWAGSR